MSLVDFLMFLTTVAGATSIIVGSYLLEPLRQLILRISGRLQSFIECPMCVGFWVGLFVAIPFGINPIVGGLTSSFVSWASYTIIDAASSLASYYDNIDGVE